MRRPLSRSFEHSFPPLLMIMTRQLLAVFLLFAFAAASWADRPNVLIIMADDCTFNDLPIYGGQNAFTPNLEQLASEGLVFNRAYLTAAMCQPCRAELYSGLYPMSNGCAWNHSASMPDTKSMPHHLEKARLSGWPGWQGARFAEACLSLRTGSRF